MTAAIQLRLYHRRREDNARTSWMTRHIAQYIAMGYQVEKGKPNPPLEAAQTLSLDPVEALLLGGSSDSAVKENKTGSYERFMMQLGANGGKKPGE